MTLKIDERPDQGPLTLALFRAVLLLGAVLFPCPSRLSAESLQEEVTRLRAELEELKLELSKRPRSPGDYPVPRRMTFCGEELDLTPPEVRRRFKEELTQVLDQRRLMTNVLRRAHAVFPVIEREARAVGGCPDLKHLAVAESALIGGAKSHAGAQGWWQFIRSTAEQYKLVITPEYDARRELISSTHTAFKYLNVLHKAFGSWPLAMASYNAGRGRVRSAQQKQGQRDFWSLDLPREAERYVPRILALTYVMTRLEAHDFRPAEPEAPPPELIGLELKLKRSAFVEKVRVQDQRRRKSKSTKKIKKRKGRSKPKPRFTYQPTDKVSLARVSQVVGTPLIYLREHNPALIGSHLPLDVSFHIWVPARGVEALKNHLKGGVLKQRGLGPLYVGGVDEGLPPAQLTPHSPSQHQPPQARSERYEVKRGDSLFLISARFGVSVEKLRQWNGLTASTPLRRGQTLTLSEP